MRIRNTAKAGALIATGLLLAACGGGGGGDNKAPGASSKARDAAADWAEIHAAIPTTKLTATVTAANDGNHLLGRPHQYTSAIKFADTRIKAADVDGLDKDDVTRGGGIEVFGNHADAQARADYIQAVTKGIPALSEYDYVSGGAVVRVSYLLTPAEAAGYKRVAAALG
jgi:hypothetical protein